MGVDPAGRIIRRLRGPRVARRGNPQRMDDSGATSGGRAERPALMSETAHRAGRAGRARPAASAREATKGRLTFRDFLSVVGPGLISGGADNDPAGIATYSIVGATVGFAQNWLLFISTPMLIVIQQMSAKVANVAKTDLATLLRTTFVARVATPAVLLVLIANVITMGAELLAV